MQNLQNWKKLVDSPSGAGMEVGGSPPFPCSISMRHCDLEGFSGYSPREFERGAHTPSQRNPELGLCRRDEHPTALGVLRGPTERHRPVGPAHREPTHTMFAVPYSAEAAQCAMQRIALGSERTIH
jgi:hypothetical protein